MRSSKEAFWWSLFSAGGVLAALCLPAFIAVTGFVLPFSGDEDFEARYGRIHELVSLWPVRLGLFIVVLFSLFHCGHRIRHILMDLGLRSAPVTLPVCCYGGALVGAVLIAGVLSAL